MATLSQQMRFYRQNRSKLRKRLQADEDYDGLAIIPGSSFVQSSADQVYPFVQNNNFFYLTGLEEPGVILVIDKKDEYLIVPDRNEVRVAFEGAVDEAKLTQISGVETILGQEAGWKRLGKSVKKTAHIATFKEPPFYLDVLDTFANPARQHLHNQLREYSSSYTTLDLGPHMVALRTIKSAYEIRMIEQAIKHTQKLFTIIERKRAKAVGEHDLLAEITRYRIKHQLVDAYEPIIASGSNAVTLHYVKNNAAIDKRSLLLLDIGLKYNGYSADLTRTVSFSNSKRQRLVYEAVLAVQEFAISLLKPGTMMREYEKEVMQFMGEKLRELGLIDSITKEVVRKYYPHSTSHFLGLDVHDVGDYELPLQPGVVLTVEPGIYIPEEGIGVRIEDNVLITKEGNRVLSAKLPRNISSLTLRA